MKNKSVRLINLVGIITILVMMLTGCGNNELKTYDKEEPINTNLSDLSEENKISNENSEELNNLNNENSAKQNTTDSNKSNSTQQNTTKDTEVKGSVESVNFQVGHIEGNIYGILHAYDKNGNEIWKYTTRNYLDAQYERVEYLDSIESDGKVYINEAGTIIAFNKQTGKIIWKNSDFGGAGSIYTLGENDSIYISGSDGPDLCVIDKNGKTIKKIQSLSDEYFWPSDMRFDIDNNINKNDLIIEFAGGGSETDEGYDAGGIVRVNLNDYTYKAQPKVTQ